MLSIKGNLYDLWEVRTIEKHKEMPEHGDDFQYSIILNREGKATNAENIKIDCDDEADQLATMKDIQERLEENENIMIF